MTLNFLRTIALTILLAGAMGSLGLMLNAGRHTPLFLLILFVGWVLSPFLALLAANGVSKRWPVNTHVMLYWLMLLLSPGSVVSYSGTFSYPGTKPAFIFLVVPFISWLLIVLVILIARRVSRRNKRI